MFLNYLMYNFNIIWIYHDKRWALTNYLKQKWKKISLKKSLDLDYKDEYAKYTKKLI